MADVTFTEADVLYRMRREVFHAAPHLHPLYRAALDGLIDVSALFANMKSLTINSTMGSVVIVFDAWEAGTGPDGFDQAVLGQLFNSARGVTVVTKYGPDPYAWAASAAIETGGAILLIETVPGQEQAWLDRVKPSPSAENWSLFSAPHAGSA